MLFIEVNKPVWCICTHAVNNHCYYTSALEQDDLGKSLERERKGEGERRERKREKEEREKGGREREREERILGEKYKDIKLISSEIT